MLEIVYLVLVVILIAASGMVTKSYESRHPNGGAIFYSAACCFFVCIFFLFSSGFHLEFDVALLPYVISFGLSYGIATVSTYYAIRTGPLSLTYLIISYSLVIPTLYGLFFCGENVGVTFYIGLAFLFVSLFLIGKTGEDNHTEN